MNSVRVQLAMPGVPSVKKMPSAAGPKGDPTEPPGGTYPGTGAADLNWSRTGLRTNSSPRKASRAGPNPARVRRRARAPGSTTPR